MHFEQVVRNLLANAIKFSPPLSTITVRARLEMGEIELTVRDEGPGIPPSELEAVFDPFVQSSRTNNGSGGTGLGLSICRKIMSAHGGAIMASNAEGGGALLRVALPESAAGRLSSFGALEPRPA